MRQQWAKIILLYWPVVGALSCLLLIILPIPLPTAVLKVPLGSAVFEVPLQAALQPLALSLIMVGFLLIALVRDYSSLFPADFKVIVCFDNKGIDTFLAELRKNDLGRLSIPHDWRQRKSAYFADINEELEKLQESFRFTEQAGRTWAQGKLTFKVKKTHWGMQLYQIMEATGTLEHITDVPGASRHSISSHFQLLEGSAPLIRASPMDVIMGRVLIVPEFQQLYRPTLSQVLSRGPLIAATRIEILPVPNISDTLYLRQQDDGTNIPVAYGTYSLA